MALLRAPRSTCRIGKTTILRTLVLDARQRGYTTLETRAVEMETQLAFGGLADLLDASFDEVIDRLPPAQQTALEIALQRTVEAHLTRIYRSLGVRGRTDLARVLAGRTSHGTARPDSGPDQGYG